MDGKLGVGVVHRAAALVLATAFAAAGGLASTGCSLILDFSESADAGPEDNDGGGGVVDAFGNGDAPPPCDAFEPNNDISNPTLVDPGTHPGLAICPGGDRDFYRFSVDAGQDMTVEIRFDNMGGAGDLEMRLYDGTGTQVAVSMTFDDNELIERTAANMNQLPADDYTAEVFGNQASVQNDYTLLLTVAIP
jgi:hypothetical protein